MAGSDFIKTSTGKESVNATIPFGIVMCRAIREYQRKAGYKVNMYLFHLKFYSSAKHVYTLYF